MEYEVRYYYPKESLDNILKNIKDLELSSNKYHEITVQYNHPSKEYDFYKKEVDGRFRIRISENEIEKICKISFKRRVADSFETNVNKEIEKEVHIDSNDIDDLFYILDNVLHLKKVESYERNRFIFYNDEVEIAVDEYPFGVAVEIEAIKNVVNPKEVVLKWEMILNLDSKRKYRLSWDDKYHELCDTQNIEEYSDVLFDKPMPKVN